MSNQEVPPFLQHLRDTIRRDVLSRGDLQSLVDAVADAERWEDPLYYLTHPKGIAALEALEENLADPFYRTARIAVRALIMQPMQLSERKALIDKALVERRAILNSLPKPVPVVLDLSKIKI